MAAAKYLVLALTILVPILVVFADDAPLPSPPGLSGLPEALAPKAHEDEPNDPQSRLFFNLIPSLTSCNYTTEPGRTCRSCNQALTCLPSNVGILRSCRGLFQYCNDGRCSLRQGSACTTSTSSTTSTTTTTTSTTTTTQAP